MDHSLRDGRAMLRFHNQDRGRRSRAAFGRPNSERTFNFVVNGSSWNN